MTTKQRILKVSETLDINLDHMDSLDDIDLICGLEEEFDIDLDSNESARSIEGWVKVVEDKLNE